MSDIWQPGKLVSVRDRDWVVLPSDDPDLLLIKPLGGSDEETTGIYLPLGIPLDKPKDAQFAYPSAEDLGDISTARLLYDAARLAFRNGAGPFRAFAKLSFRPRAYQIVPLVMALRQNIVRLLIADDVGVGKTVEALLIVREMIERAQIKRFAVICLPHLCDQWQQECRAKLGIEAVIIRSNTQARLDRMIQGDASVYDYYPYQIISIDYIKADSRQAVFIEQCPELVIVDEVHTCARPAGASKSQQQRHLLLRNLADKPEQNLIMLTATPHSGKPEEFHSLLGLLDSDFESIDLPKSSQSERRTLARHFIQRKRADVEKWMGEDTPFPNRDTIEWNYDLSPTYLSFFNDVVDFARKLIAPERSGETKQRAHYWTALGLLRGVMSSPSAGVKMLTSRRSKLTEVVVDAQTDDDVDDGSLNFNPIGDSEYGVLSDIVPTQVIAQREWTDHQRRQLRSFTERLEAIAGSEDDQKLFAASIVLEDWILNGYHPVVFCRFIETANYLGEYLAPYLTAHIPNLVLEVVTSEDPDELRKQRIEEMDGGSSRILIATDCLSQGVNLQEMFTAVLHYDLPWNPNDLEQREGRVDRFGQQASEVKACLLYGADNPIDGIVLDVLLRKVREIKRSTGINVPFPEDSQSIIDTITQSLLLNPERRIQTRQSPLQGTLFDFSDFGEAIAAKENVSRRIDEAAEREKVSRSIFAQNAIKAQEIEEDLRIVDEAIGDPTTVKDFVVGALKNLFGVQIIFEQNGFGIVTNNLPHQLSGLLPDGQIVNVSFESPTPCGYHYLGRNHSFVEQLCQCVMSNTVTREGKRAARAAVIRSHQVDIKTTLFLFRCRNVIEQDYGYHQIVAEEMLLGGWRGTPIDREYLDHVQAHHLLRAITASSNISLEARSGFLENELGLLEHLDEAFYSLAEERSMRLVASHERFSALMDNQRYHVVYPILPMDLMGIYIILPEDKV